VHVLSSPPSFLGWHAILRPLQKKHARNGSFLGCFFPRLPRRDGDEPSSSSQGSSDSAPLPPRPSRCIRGSVSGYVMNVRVGWTGVSGSGVDAGEDDWALGTDEGRCWLSAFALAAATSSGYGRWPIGDLARGDGTPCADVMVLGFERAGVGVGPIYWFCVSAAGGDAATYGCCWSSRAIGGA
jgi:hypothetical protein